MRPAPPGGAARDIPASPQAGGVSRLTTRPENGHSVLVAVGADGTALAKSFSVLRVLADQTLRDLAVRPSATRDGARPLGETPLRWDRRLVAFARAIDRG